MAFACGFHASNRRGFVTDLIRYKMASAFALAYSAPPRRRRRRAAAARAGARDFSNYRENPHGWAVCLTTDLKTDVRVNRPTIDCKTFLSLLCAITVFSRLRSLARPNPGMACL